MKSNYRSILLVFALSVTTITFANKLGGNDTCTGAVNLSCGDVYTGDTADNTDTGGSAAPDEFYKYTGDGSLEEITISLCSDITDYDSYLRVFTDCTFTSEVIANDDSCELQSEVSFLSDGTATYYIMVEGYQANSGMYQIEINCVTGLTNDSCTFATPITCGDAIAGETTMDTDSGFNESPDEFFIFTGDGFEQEVTVTLCDGGTDYDSWLRVFSACDLNNQITNNDDTCELASQVTFESDGISSYIIMVEGYQANSGDFSLSISCSGPPMPPPNDLIENAIELENDGSGFYYTDENVMTQDATAEEGGTMSCSLDGINGVWYKGLTQTSYELYGAINSPEGIRAVIFFTAPSLNATIDELTKIDNDSNPCFTGDSAIAYIDFQTVFYAFAANMGAPSNIDISGVTLGMETNLFSGFTILPNPANDFLSLDNSNPIEQLRVINVLGQTILSKKVGATNTKIDISALKVGTYFAEVTIEGSTNTYQFIKK
ncbi:MAG: hypothetical protein ACI836_000013 [Saprospiraceae bacterium]|jgi:hypothetical protein|uniref:T9SS type A sorting domain-containing protein n=1 Tax=Patiriisocius sp. Uisw_047 TaxID=3230969 RepID=UPI0039E74B49